jgi:hypothetical protein
MFGRKVYIEGCGICCGLGRGDEDLFDLSFGVLLLS